MAHAEAPLADVDETLFSQRSARFRQQTAQNTPSAPVCANAKRWRRLAIMAHSIPGPIHKSQQLRHSAENEIQKHFGIEASQVTLGHAAADTTQAYAERDLQKAAEVMEQVGQRGWTRLIGRFSSPLLLQPVQTRSDCCGRTKVWLEPEYGA
jgi:site-specific recombinase XerC